MISVFKIFVADKLLSIKPLIGFLTAMTSPIAMDHVLSFYKNDLKILTVILYVWF